MVMTVVVSRREQMLLTWPSEGVLRSGLVALLAELSFRTGSLGVDDRRDVLEPRATLRSSGSV